MHALKKRRAWWNLAVYCLGYNFLFPLTAFLLMHYSFALEEYSGLLEGLIYGVTFAFIVLASWDFLKIEIQLFLSQIEKVLKEVITHQALMYILNFICNLIILLVSGLEESNNQQQVIELLHAQLFSTVFITIVFAPLVEELVFRASIFSIVGKKRRSLAIVLASCAFGLLHVLGSVFSGDWLDCLYLISYASMGFCLCRCYLKTETIVGPILLHCLNNTISVIILLMA